MKKLEYDLQFVTPAFLGNAGQQGQWRTPPLKTMLRQWWRVLKAHEYGYDHNRLLTEENKLFGAAFDDNASSQSRVRLRLVQADPEKNPGTAWQAGDRPALNKTTQDDVYMGFGPITLRSQRNAIPDRQSGRLILITDNDETAAEMGRVISLCRDYATLGSRNRNGWGSLSIICDEITAVDTPSRPLDDALTLDWTHAIGRDNKGLLRWQTTAGSTWRDAMLELLSVRKNIINATAKEQSTRAAVSYPVTGDNSFGKKYRQPSQMLFKIHRNNNGYVGIISHFPHKMPVTEEMRGTPETASNLLNTWRAIHTALDNKNGLSRVKG